MEEKILSIADLKTMSQDDFLRCVEDGYKLSSDDLRLLTIGKYHENIFHDVLLNSNILTRCLILLKKAGLKANFREYGFDYNLFNNEFTASLVLDAVDLRTLDSETIIKTLISMNNIDVLKTAIEKGILERVDIAKCVLFANSIGKTEQAMVLASSNSSQNELSLDSDIIADEWEYEVTPKHGLIFTKYIGKSNIIEIPNYFHGQIVRGISGDIIKDSEIVDKSKPIFFYYRVEDERSKEIFYSIEDKMMRFSNKGYVALLTNMKNIKKYDLRLYYHSCIVIGNCETMPIIEDDFVLVKQDDACHLIKYIGNDSEVIIPAGITSIKRSAFSDMDIKPMRFIYIPRSVQNVSHNAITIQVDTIYAGSKSKPIGWAYDFYTNCDNVVWNIEHMDV